MTHHKYRYQFLGFSILIPIICFFASPYWPHAMIITYVMLPFILIGYVDMFQKKQSIRRNFPLIGNFRYFFEMIRPEINQYFVESNIDGRPFSRETRSIVYQRAKGAIDTIPFGTQHHVYAPNYEWVEHSIYPAEHLHEDPRVIIGSSLCKQKYAAAHLNISAMSYGSLSPNAVASLNKGAKLGNFYHNTGEGGLTPYHLQNGGDITWQIGTGYFGCRDKKTGLFDANLFQEKALLPQVKMIEIKLSQGAKPGHGGILPKEKLTQEIANIRGVEMGKDVISPPHHTAFQNAYGLIAFVQRLRDLSGGKPIGFKMCVGRKIEFLDIVKAMKETNIFPDFITVDGAEGGTGAAPLEFSNSIGTPLNEGLSFVTRTLQEFDLKKEIRVIASGRVITGFDIYSKLALGADICNSARGMMFALGCIQALRCNTNKCPTGVATQEPELYRGLDITDKSVRVARYQAGTIKSFLEIVAATGLKSPSEISPEMVFRRISPIDVKSFGEIYFRL
jgi:glutamate synthase domain-containing protein 2